MNNPSLVEELFLATLERGSLTERADYLREACQGDDELQRRVERLLAAQAKVGGFLEAPAMALVDVPAPPGAAMGDIIAGRYRLLEPIGEGGMGTVWVAEQTEPIRRRVALKLIKPGMDSQQVLSRFESERQALALMDHPNIAKVLDGGLADDGRPFFAMELVKGMPMTEFCDAHQLELQERLELFLPVCRAIQHAHQKGIIHRDIKPSNVLIALYDEKPVPKVIDFGLAKAVGQIPAEGMLATQFGGIVGTPAYMSPEQATLNNLDIDTRSDIYSLGVLLYELLVGSTPFSEQALRNAGMLEMLRIVREEEPPWPSTKLSTAEALPRLCANRGMESAKLTHLLRQDLDWIVIKALEKDRVRRYDTASGFAEDIGRYLAGDAVHAHPPGRVYRLRKFLHRHRRPVLAAVLVIATLLAGIAGTTLGLFEARKQTRLANESLLAEHAAKQRAEELLRAFTVAHSELIYSVVNFEWLRDATPAAARENLTNRLDDEARWIDSCGLTDPVAVHELRCQLSHAYRKIELPEKALKQCRLSLTAAEAIDSNGPQVVLSLFEMSLVHKAANQPAAAAATRQRAAGLARSLALPTNDSTRRSWHQLAMYLREFGGEPDLAARFVEQLLSDTRSRLGPRHRETLLQTHHLAWARLRQGRNDEAITLERESVTTARTEFGDTDSGVIQMVHDAQQLLLNVGRVDPILLATVREVLGDDRVSDGLLALIGADLLKERRWNDAETILRKCVTLREKSKPDGWTTFNAMSLLGESLLSQQKYADAEPLLVKAYQGMSLREATIPASAKFRMKEAVERLITLFTALQKPDEVRKWQAVRDTIP